jgi:uncharacterized protein
LILFLDTSALVKLYIAEAGSERVREAAIEGEDVAVSVLAFAEINATFSRRRREGLLAAVEYQDLRICFSDDWRGLTQVPVGPEVLALVPGLCENHPLRGADAVHLASALLLRAEGLEILFACSDGRLVQAASSEGLAVLDLRADAQNV